MYIEYLTMIRKTAVEVSDEEIAKYMFQPPVYWRPWPVAFPQPQLEYKDEEGRFLDLRQPNGLKYYQGIPCAIGHHEQLFLDMQKLVSKFYGHSAAAKGCDKDAQEDCVVLEGLWQLQSEQLFDGNITRKKMLINKFKTAGYPVKIHHSPVQQALWEILPAGKATDEIGRV